MKSGGETQPARPAARRSSYVEELRVGRVGIAGKIGGAACAAAPKQVKTASA